MTGVWNKPYSRGWADKEEMHTSSGNSHRRIKVREDGYLSPFSSTVSAPHWPDPVDGDQAQNRTTTGEVRANDHPRLVLYLWGGQLEAGVNESLCQGNPSMPPSPCTACSQGYTHLLLSPDSDITCLSTMANSFCSEDSSCSLSSPGSKSGLLAASGRHPCSWSLSSTSRNTQHVSIFTSTFITSKPSLLGALMT